jgi:ABC-type lipoprotein export system ATPase subunit/ABC-type antimicrobial peptide transport system permease subunit
MIELRDVCKSYKMKNGPEVKALDHVNISFGEKGLVFILGKSGAGKSTMLNVIGGLDRIDSGDIVIMGKPSKDFSQAEFDSYRNTYLGFIFQEYNILNEFTVGQNIALAMQLQSLKGERSDVEAILDQVDLHGLYDRKPNELSGGQKQRVAIARALIKKPQIIMADEPTGALDSKTGQDIFNTLKKLAQDHLVIVVSHDRDFAESFGDRVIEMKDGKIISDITKSYVKSEEVSEGVQVLSDSLISFKPGHVLSEKDVQLLNSYLARADQETLVSIDDTVNTSAKTTAKIDEKGQRGTFSNTTPEMVGAKDYQGSEFQLKKSKLPFARSFKMALHSLRAKPFRLVITLLLIISSMTLFGVTASLASYSSEKAFIETFSSFNTDSFKVDGAYEYLDDYSVISHRFSSRVVQSIREETDASMSLKDPHLDFFSLLSSNTQNNIQTSFQIASCLNKETSDASILYPNFVSDNQMIQEDESTAASNGNTLVAGRYPSAENEVAVSSYYYAWASKYGWSNSVSYVDAEGNTNYTSAIISHKDFSSEKEFLAKGPLFQIGKYTYDTAGNEKTSQYNLHDFKVVGIVKSTFDLAPYAELESLATKSDPTVEETNKVNAYHLALVESDALAIFGDNSFFNAVVGIAGKTYSDDYELYSSLTFELIPSDETYGKFYRLLKEHATFGYNSPYFDGKFQYRSETNDKTKEQTNGSLSLSGQTSSYYAFNNIDFAVTALKTGLFWAGFATACFACLLLATFIASSIAYQKRQIGILRAIGARGMDIYGIFWNEAIFLSLVGAAVGLILTGILDLSLSRSLIAATPLVSFSIFQFSWIPVALLLGLSFLTGTIASFLPCLIISKKKPIDSINDR